MKVVKDVRAKKFHCTSYAKSSTRLGPQHSVSEELYLISEERWLYVGRIFCKS